MKKLLILSGFLQIFTSAFVFADFTVYCFEVDVTIDNRTHHGYFIAPYDHLEPAVLDSFHTPNVLLNEIRMLPAYSDSLILFDRLIIPEIATDPRENSTFYTSKSLSQSFPYSKISNIELVAVHTKWPGTILVSVLEKSDTAWIPEAIMKTMQFQHGETLLVGYCAVPTQQVISLMEDYFEAHENNDDKRISEILRIARQYRLLIVNICGA